MNTRSTVLPALLAMLGPWALYGGEWTGYLSTETRVFENKPLIDGQKEGANFAAVVEPEFYHEWSDGNRAFEFGLYGRVDSHDDERNLVDIRELSYLVVDGDWEIRAGISKVFWGVTESQHLVDTINQTDLVANPDGEDKLGQPMLQVTRISAFGDFSAFLLPGFRERTFPGIEGRLRTAIPVDTDRPIYESAAEEGHIDGALRWFNVIGDFDVGLHYFRGTRRDPLLILDSEDPSDPVFRPYYEQMDQVGLDLQYTKGGWLLKFEGIGRDAASEEFSAMVGGFEYTFYGIGGTAIDTGLLVEGHFDSRGGQAPTPFNKDIFVGTRLTWNDSADTALVFGGFFDLESESMLGRFEFERRIGKSQKLEFEIQKPANVDSGDPLNSLRRDSYAQLAFSWYW